MPTLRELAAEFEMNVNRFKVHVKDHLELEDPRADTEITEEQADSLDEYLQSLAAEVDPSKLEPEDLDAPKPELEIPVKESQKHKFRVTCRGVKTHRPITVMAVDESEAIRLFYEARKIESTDLYRCRAVRED